MNKKILMLLIIGMFLISFTSAICQDGAGNLGIKDIDECVRISQTCASCSYVNISSVTLSNSNESLIDNVEMENFGNGEWIYNFCDTSEKGSYEIRGKGDLDSVDTSFKSCFDIGEEISLGRIIIQISLLIILFLGFSSSVFGVFKIENYIGRFTLYWISHVLMIAISFISWQMAQDYLLGTPMIAGIFKIIFYFVTIGMFPMILLSMVWIFYIHLMNDDIKKMIERGMPELEAHDRARRKKKW
jgi:hypothetical protein